MLSGILVGRIFSTALVVVMQTSIYETIMVKNDEYTILCNVTPCSLVRWVPTLWRNFPSPSSEYKRGSRFHRKFCAHLL